MTAHLINKETYDALGMNYTLERITAAGQYITIDRDGIIVYWPADLDADQAINLPAPADCHFNTRIYFVNDSGMDQTFISDETTYTVPAAIDMEVRISIREGAKAFVATYYSAPE